MYSDNAHKLGELREFLDKAEKMPDVICIQETWNHKGQNLLRLPNYKTPISHRREKGKKGGGVAIFVKIGLDSEEIQFHHPNKLVEVKIVRVFGTKQNIDIANYYTPGKDIILSSDYSKIAEKMGKNAIITGDFNARSALWETGFKGDNSNAKEIIEFLNSSGFVVINTGCGTRFDISRGTTSAIDLTLTTAAISHKCEWKVLENSFGSDHHPTITTLELSHAKASQERKPRWLLEKADWANFKTMTDQINIPFGSLTISEANEKFTAELMAACKNAIPESRAVTGNKKTVPWWNETCAQAVKKKNKAYYKYKKYKTEHYLAIYRQARNESKFIITAIKKQKWEDFISTLNRNTPSKKVWDTLRKFNGKPFRPVETLELNGRRIHSNADKAECLNRHYQTVSSNQALEPTFQQHKEEQEPLINQTVSQKSRAGERRAYNAVFTVRELRTALGKKRSTAPGADTVHYEMLKQLTDKGIFQLLGLINKSWMDGELPSQWKESDILPILKPDKSPKEPKSYRPISLTSCICKVMETMIATRLATYIDKNNLLANTQSGFRKNRSTLDQLVRLESEIKVAQKKGKALVAVFLDLEKAFDLMWRKGVLLKLTEFGIEGRLLNWIGDFLADRKIRVRVGKETSEKREVENGSPQGSVISPILFNVIMNSLSEEIGRDPVALSQFADDSAIWKATRKPQTAIKHLQITLNKIENWGKNWGFRISAEKTKCVIFNRNSSTYAGTPKLKFGGVTLTFETKAKLLGMIFDNNLTWNSHIEMIKEKCQKGLNILKMVSGTSYGSDKKTMLQLYMALIRSKIDYGSQAYNSAAARHLIKVDSIQNAALRIATRAYKGTQSRSLEVECNIMPLRLRREELQMKYWARSCIHKENLPINSLVEPRPEYIDHPPNRLPYCINIQRLLEKYSLADVKIQPISYPVQHNLRSILPKLGLKGIVKKGTDPPADSAEKARSYIRNHYWGSLQIYTDGSKDGASNATACALVIPDLNITQKFKLNEHLSIFTAELLAIRQALIWINRNAPEKVVILSDSQSAIQCILSGRSSTRHDVLEHVLHLIHCALQKHIILSIDWCPSHIGIEGNEAADNAAKSALRHGKVIDILPSAREIYPLIKSKVRAEWAREWRDSHGFRHELDPGLMTKVTTYSQHRKLDIKYTRLRLGVNGLKANNIFYNEADPLCPHCTDIEDTEHYLIKCPAHNSARKQLKQSISKISGNQNLNLGILLNTKSQEIRDAVFQYLDETGYTDII
ncbi:MAG: endonuclease/exonuclease/phosphatase family protein [Candidatus Thiodiazotropha sp. (ex Monitilora ramsayi)]|nr:endonuclease/exonuclease/phosphatase family protein [Candidatus Thiodiazotropha sp. (ex Monitilora ramsayi)]